MESECIGGLSDQIWGTQYHQQDRVYSMGDVALCHPANIPQGSYKYLEIQKIDVNQIGNFAESEKRDNPNQYRVYDSEGLSPTLTNMQGGGRQPHIVEVEDLTRKETGECILAEQSRAEQSSLVYVRQATKEGKIPLEIGGVADLDYPTSKTRRGRVIDKGNVSPTLMTESTPSVVEKWLWKIQDTWYRIRIRKLTPRECWRLMDFNEGAFDKAENVCSNTQLYKQAGNSIVVNVLVAIFGQMIEGKEDFYKND